MRPDPLKPVNVATGGVHPLVVKSMLPRIKDVKRFTPAKQAASMSAMQKGPKILNG
jgi:hypothetical protein